MTIKEAPSFAKLPIYNFDDQQATGFPKEVDALNDAVKADFTKVTSAIVPAGRVTKGPAGYAIDGLGHAHAFGLLALFPLLLVAGYVAERRWLHAAVAIGTASMLWLNILAFDVLLYTQIGGPSFYVGGVSLFSVSPLLWLPIAVACAGVVIVLAVRRSPWTWLAAGAAIPLSVPRVWLPDAAYVLVGLHGTRDRIASRTLSGTARSASPGGTSVRESS